MASRRSLLSLRSFRFRSFALAFMAVLAITGNAQKAEARSGGPFGLGVVLGDPSALTVDYRLSRDRDIDGGIAFDLNRWFLIYSDWHASFPGAFGRSNQFVSDLSPYLGIGGLLVVSNKDDWETRHQRYFSETSDGKLALGFRIPLGIEWRPSGVPVGVFVEIVPGMTVIPGTYGFVQGGLGARFFF